MRLVGKEHKILGKDFLLFLFLDQFYYRLETSLFQGEWYDKGHLVMLTFYIDYNN